jgi:phosphate transport system protein
MAIHMLREVEKLKKMFLAVAALVEENLRDSVKAAIERDRSLAMRVIEKDNDIDREEVAVEEECLKLLALYQPVANDLRYIVAILKINHDMERVGDLAVNIAERAIILSENGIVERDFGLRDMAARVQAMLGRSLDALLNNDIKLAKEIWLSDDGIDEANRNTVGELESEIQRDPAHCKGLLALTGISRTLERIADHTTNVAKEVIYMISGEIVRHRSRFFREEMNLPPENPADTQA